MQSFASFSLLILLFCQIVLGLHFENSLERDKVDDNIDGILNPSASSLKASGELSEISSGNYDITSEYRSDSASSSASENTTGAADSSEYALSQSQSTEYSTSGVSSEYVSSIDHTETSTGIFSNESHSNHSEEYSSSESSAIANGRTQSGRKSTLFFVTPSSETNESSSQPDEEPEGVVIGRPSSGSESTVTPQPKTIYQKTLELISDTYTLSILIPVAAGIIFASTIIVTIATCRCFRRRCRRRRLRKKMLPDSVKNLRPSDRARLLAESSDEEF